MPSFHPFWLLVAIAVPLPLLFLAEVAPHSSVPLMLLWDLGHIPLFAAWTLIALRWLPWPLTKTFVALRALLLLTIAISIEFIQRYTGRDFSVQDMLLGSCGIVLGLRLGWPAMRNYAKRQRYRWPDIALVLMLMIGLQESGIYVFDRLMQWRQFPQLWSASQPMPMYRLSSTTSTREWVAATTDSPQELVRVTFGTEKYSLVSLHRIAADWRNYRHLHISLLNPDSADLNVACRIHDTPHDISGRDDVRDRFRREFTLSPGWHDLAIPLADIESAPAGRKMQMDQIADLSCFTVQLNAPRQIYLRKIWLAR